MISDTDPDGPDIPTSRTPALVAAHPHHLPRMLGTKRLPHPLGDPVTTSVRAVARYSHPTGNWTQ